MGGAFFYFKNIFIFISHIVKFYYVCDMEKIKEKQQAISPSNLMSVNDYAKHIGKDRRTVYNMINDGRIKQVEFLGKKWIDKSTLKGE